MDPRPLPEWFATPQLGIFIHWTMATVPAFAPLSDDPFTMGKEHGWAYAMKHSPYVEWYENSLAIEGSPVQEFHRAHYGEQPYAAFAPQWISAMQHWDPSDWVQAFVDAGASYVVLVTKHHDGFCLWPTTTPNPHRENWHAERDLVGELASACRERGLRFGTYYSGGLDWTFRGPHNGYAITDFEAMLRAVPTSDDYRDYATAHFHELIDRHRPDVLWNDIHWPFPTDDLFAYYYDKVPHGVVNDRFNARAVAKGLVHADFVTPEYRSRPSGDSVVKKFEVCRGIGRSFGYNKLEGDADYLPTDELCALHDDVLAGGGNLLLNVGPMADGTIPDAQLGRLAALGAHRRAEH